MQPTPLQGIVIKLLILDEIIKEAREAGDERWKEAARQARELNKQRIELIRDERRRRGIPEPSAQTIHASIGLMGARGEQHG